MRTSTRDYLAKLVSIDSIQGREVEIADFIESRYIENQIGLLNEF